MRPNVERTSGDDPSHASPRDCDLLLLRDHKCWCDCHESNVWPHDWHHVFYIILCTILAAEYIFDKPLLGEEVAGGSDTECPYIRISAIRPGSLAERSRMLKMRDELVEVDSYLMVEMTHNEAIDNLGICTSPDL